MAEQKRLGVQQGPGQILDGPQAVRFLMQQLQEMQVDLAAADTMEAENLASRYLQSDANFQPGSQLSPTGLPGVWQLASTNGHVIALFNEITVGASVDVAAINSTLDSPADLALLAPGMARISPFGPYLPVRGPTMMTPARAAAAPARCTIPEPA